MAEKGKTKIDLSQSHREGGEGNLIGFKIRKPSSPSVALARTLRRTSGCETAFPFLSDVPPDDLGSNPLT
jgi:hypothetical protein